MNRVVLLLFCLLLPVFLLAQSKALAVVRLINTESISNTEFNKKLTQAEQLVGKAFAAREKSLLLDQMIDSTLILQQAKKDSIIVEREEVVRSSLALLSQQQGRQITEAELKQQLQQVGTSFTDFIDDASKQLVLQKYILNKYGEELKNIPLPSDSDVENFYDTYPQRFVIGDRVRFEQIFIKTVGLNDAGRKQAQQKAQDLFKRVQNGENLGNLASTYSEETVSRDNKGNVGYVVKNDEAQIKRFGTSFFKQIFKMKVNDLQLLSSNIGWHIVQVKEFKVKALLGLDDLVEPGQTPTVRKVIRSQLAQQQQQQQLVKIQQREIKELRTKASIRMLKENIPFNYEQTS